MTSIADAKAHPSEFIDQVQDGGLRADVSVRCSVRAHLDAVDRPSRSRPRLGPLESIGVTGMRDQVWAAIILLVVIAACGTGLAVMIRLP